MELIQVGIMVQAALMVLNEKPVIQVVKEIGILIIIQQLVLIPDQLAPALTLAAI
jgi:hypothetical protein